MPSLVSLSIRLGGDIPDLSHISSLHYLAQLSVINSCSSHEAPVIFPTLLGLQTVVLSSCYCDDVPLIANLTSLQLRQVKAWSSASSFEWLSRHPTLRSLSLPGQQLSLAEMAGASSAFPQLDSLVCGRIQGSTKEPLFPSLTSLRCTSATSESILSVTPAQSTKLTHLDLSNSQAAVLNAAMSFPGLTSLNLSACILGRSAIARLSEMNAPNLRVLALSDNSPLDFQALSKLSSITELNLHLCGDEQAPALLPRLPLLRTLYLPYKTGCREIPGLYPNLTEIHFADDDLRVMNLPSFLDRMKSLEVLSVFSAWHLNSSDLRAAARLPRLRSFRLPKSVHGITLTGHCALDTASDFLLLHFRCVSTKRFLDRLID
jgi:Leucine-rich repeat (LRR) protein